MSCAMSAAVNGIPGTGKQTGTLLHREVSKAGAAEAQGREEVRSEE